MLSVVGFEFGEALRGEVLLVIGERALHEDICAFADELAVGVDGVGWLA